MSDGGIDCTVAQPRSTTACPTCKGDGPCGCPRQYCWGNLPTDRPSQERQQLEITRDALNTRAGEFQQFANDNKLQPQSATPVKLDGKAYYDNGHTEWDHAETQMMELCHDMPLACLSADAGPGARKVNKREFTKTLLRAERGLVTVPN
ncbi:hypothetical protein [Cupriavidus sp. L7L]|uniref:hypothetical protein n=1 Tax=Cupriavidus sp. L7L TaxID=2546443 RepID=UPI00105517AB|nr:hypothetical protein [Cupriavidus sp. L7L]TDF66781.1 hypothetical protein E1J61_05710 [Cupriavidus sp. L7L]